MFFMIFSSNQRLYPVIGMGILPLLEDKSSWDRQRNKCQMGLHFFWNKKRLGSDSLIPHHMGKLVLVNRLFTSCCYTCGYRIAAIASAFQAEIDRGFESHYPLHWQMLSGIHSWNLSSPPCFFEAIQTNMGKQLFCRGETLYEKFPNNSRCHMALSSNG